MKGLIIKDILNLKKVVTTTFIMIFVYGIFSYSIGDMSMLIGMTTFIMASMSITSMTYDEMAKWDSYALAMPITRRDIVLSKYILSFLLSITATIISSIFSIIITYLRGDLGSIENIQEIFLIAYIMFLICMVFTSVITPLIFKFGVENARLLTMGSVLIPIGIGYLLVKLGIISASIEELPSGEQLKTVLYVLPVILILVLIVSILTTYRIYKKKDI